MALELKNKTKYCTSRTLINELQNHPMILNRFIKTEHIEKQLDSGDFGWVLIRFNSITALLNFFKSVAVSECKKGIL